MDRRRLDGLLPERDDGRRHRRPRRLVANNFLPLGTKITVTASPTSRRRFVVRDRIGWGTQLDFWVPSCAQAIAWGRRTVRLRVGWPLNAPMEGSTPCANPHPGFVFWLILILQVRDRSS